MKAKKVILINGTTPDETSLAKSTGLIYQEFLKHGECIVLNPNELEYVFSKNELSIYYHKALISDADVVLIRGTKTAESSIYDFARAMELLGKRVIDPSPALVYSSGKLLPHIERHGHVPAPKSLYIDSISSETKALIEKACIDFPCIIKPLHGTKGKGVSLAQNINDLVTYQNIQEGPHIIQEYIPIQHEYRVVVVGGTVIGTVEKLSELEIKNAALGATFQATSHKKAEKLALKTASCHPGDIYGVDIVETKDGELFVIECNRAPVFEEFNKATGLAVEKHIVSFALSNR